MNFSDFTKLRERLFIKHKIAHKKGRIPKNKRKKRAVPREVFRYIFSLQARLEPTGSTLADTKYAQTVWRELIENNEKSRTKAYRLFDRKLKINLHNLDVSEHLYPAVVDDLLRMTLRYSSIRKLILWTKGNPRGYQAIKILHSNIIDSYCKKLAIRIGQKDARLFIREKTRVIIARHKIGTVVREIISLSKKNKKLKIVIVEDSISNFEAVMSGVKKNLDKDANEKITIIPVWAKYSRFGRQLHRSAKRASKVEDFKRKSYQLNAINSFSALNNRKRFQKIFEEAYVYIDFDGVIANNISNRVCQAEAVFDSLVSSAVAQTMRSEPTVIKLIRQNVKLYD